MKTPSILGIIKLVVIVSVITAVLIFNNNIKQDQIRLQESQTQLEEYKLKEKTLQEKIDKAQGDKKKLQQELEKTKADYKALQARKAEERRLAQERAGNAVVALEQAPQPTGSCHDWMKAAGIQDTANAYALVMRESGCNPNAVNASSGACGLGQQLPCGKWSHTWNDPIGGFIDMQAYVFGRYGSWASANAFQLANNWY